MIDAEEEKECMLSVILLEGEKVMECPQMFP
jgi:hypothetical protein